MAGESAWDSGALACRVGKIAIVPGTIGGPPVVHGVRRVNPASTLRAREQHESPANKIERRHPSYRG